jgi:hypothetical protein
VCWQASADTRTLLLDNHERLQRTNDRLANTRRVAEESGALWNPIS